MRIVIIMSKQASAKMSEINEAIEFNEISKSIFNYVNKLDGLKKNVRRYQATVRPFEADSSKKSGSTIVLRSDTFLELGSPAAGSMSFVVCSASDDSINDGEIIVIGSEVAESENKQMPLGLVILIAGRALTEEDRFALLNYSIPADLCEGFMIKSTLENIWCRISYEAAAKGLSFQRIGEALISRIKAEFPPAEAVSILFVTSEKQDVLGLKELGEPVSQMVKEMKRKIWEERGVDISQCKPGGHCGACEEKDVCQEVKKISGAYQKEAGKNHEKL
ncbi:carbon monoxide dehydrogenase [Acetobacterium sp. KB-1]|nr:carbon monoxide dehydrogenase [Acetobacterium sp. KB-1]